VAKVVKVIELLSESSKSLDDATQGAVNEASKTYELTSPAEPIHLSTSRDGNARSTFFRSSSA